MRRKVFGIVAGLLLGASACAQQWFTVSGPGAGAGETVVEIDLETVRIRNQGGEGVIRVTDNGCGFAFSGRHDHVALDRLRGDGLGTAELGGDVDGLKYFRIVETKLRDIPCEVSRTGYTGDLGFEVWIDNQYAHGFSGSRRSYGPGRAGARSGTASRARAGSPGPSS